MTVVYWCRYPGVRDEPVHSENFDDDGEAQEFAARKRRAYAYTVGKVWTKKYQEVK